MSVTSKSVTSTFSPDGNGLSNPHDVAVSRDGSAVYVVELTPRKVWRFDVGECGGTAGGRCRTAVGRELVQLGVSGALVGDLWRMPAECNLVPRS